MRNQSFSLKLALILWALGFTTPFFILEWQWALFIVVFLAVISPLVSMIFYAPFKSYATERGVKTIGFFSGLVEGLVTTLLISYLYMDTIMPDLAVFFGLLVFAYITSQVARMIREGGQTEGYTEEMWGLLGYLAILPITMIVMVAMG